MFGSSRPAGAFLDFAAPRLKARLWKGTTTDHQLLFAASGRVDLVMYGSLADMLGCMKKRPLYH
jgi:hypothetical protein